MRSRTQERDSHWRAVSEAHHAIVIIDVLLPFVMFERPKVDG